MKLYYKNVLSPKFAILDINVEKKNDIQIEKEI